MTLKPIATVRVMANLWLLAQLRQPGRQLYADLSKDTFNDFLEELLSTDNFLMKKANRRRDLGCPIWAHCMEYEFQLRRDATKLCREQGYSIQAALWVAYRNQEHRMKHWITLLSLANPRCHTTSGRASREVEQLKKSCPHEGPKGPEKVLEVIPLYKILLRRRRIKEKEDEPKVNKKQQKWRRKKKKSTYRSFCRSPQQSWIQSSPQAQQDESWILLPFPKRILLETELQAAPQLCWLRQKWDYRAMIAYAWLTSE